MIASQPVFDRAAFLDLLRSADLLTTRQFDRGVAGLPADATTARAAAAAFVRQGLLTPFQADRLAAGRGDGFLLGQYVILEPIGRGKSGRVYKARHRTMNRLVAIKVLAPERTATTADREAFTRETRAAAKLVHPHVVTAFDANQVGDRMYLVLEYVDGTDLESVVRRQGPLPVAQACDAVRQAALGLQYAHAKGVAHGGLTPANLLAGRPAGGGSPDHPVVKILNFGLARLAAFDRAESGSLTPADYLAPEQLADPGRADPAADLFALGGVLHFLLTGRPPGSAESLRPDLPPGLAELVRQLTAKEPGARPMAGELAARLGPFANETDCTAVDFDLPIVDGGGPNSGGTLLSGLLGHPSEREPSPFADLASDPGLELDGPTLTVGEATPLATRPRRRVPAPEPTGRPGLTVALMCLAGGIILATGLAIGAVLRVVVK